MHKPICLVVFTIAALSFLASKIEAGPRPLEGLDAVQRFIECGDHVYAARSAGTRSELYQLVGGKAIRVSLSGGDEFWLSSNTDPAPCNGKLLLLGSFLEGKKEQPGVFVVDGAEALPALTSKGTPFLPKQTGPHPVLHEPGTKRHATWFGADGEFYTLEGQTVSDPVAWPNPKNSMRNTRIHWTGETIVLTSDNSGFQALVLKDRSFVPIERKGGEALFSSERDKVTSLAGPYLVMTREGRDSHGMEAAVLECYRLEGAVAQQVKLPKDTVQCWLFGAGASAYGIQIDSKQKHSVLAFQDLAAKPHTGAKRVGKLGRVNQTSVGDEIRLWEGGDEPTFWRMTADAVQEMKVPKEWLLQGGVALRGRAAYVAKAPWAEQQAGNQRCRVVLVDDKGGCKFLQDDAKAIVEGDAADIVAASDGFYLALTDKSKNQSRLLFIPRE